MSCHRHGNGVGLAIGGSDAAGQPPREPDPDTRASLPAAYPDTGRNEAAGAPSHALAGGDKNAGRNSDAPGGTDRRSNAGHDDTHDAAHTGYNTDRYACHADTDRHTNHHCDARSDAAHHRHRFAISNGVDGRATADGHAGNLNADNYRDEYDGYAWEYAFDGRTSFVGRWRNAQRGCKRHDRDAIRYKYAGLLPDRQHFGRGSTPAPARGVPVGNAHHLAGGNYHLLRSHCAPVQKPGMQPGIHVVGITTYMVYRTWVGCWSLPAATTGPTGAFGLGAGPGSRLMAATWKPEIVPGKVRLAMPFCTLRTPMLTGLLFCSSQPW